MRHPQKRASVICAALALWIATQAHAQTIAPKGEIKGSAWTHTSDSLKAAVAQADVCLPASSPKTSIACGKLGGLTTHSAKKMPVVLFLHGSSGLGVKAIGEWQQWLATLGYASIAPNSFALTDRATYKSPIDTDSYEKIHALRLSEISATIAALKQQPWVDMQRLVLAGSSEGAVAVARYTGTEFAARMLFSWSCESNYFVKAPQNAFEADKPVLNIISASDQYFSKANPWLNNVQAQGHCAAALKGNPKAAVLLLPDAPHTVFNLPAAQAATAGFLLLNIKP